MENQKVSLNLPEGTNEFVVREGKALELKHPKGINISGTLGAPHQFFEGKKPNAIESHIQVFNDRGEIVLHILDTDPHCETVISGKLTRDSILEQFQLNTDKRWTIAEFLKFIKTMRFYFADKEEHKNLVESIQKWSVKVERVIVEHNDHSGNSNYQLETKVRAIEGLKNTFNLSIPIFQGYEKKKFAVEIGLDPKNVEVLLYLISDELIELEIGVREKLIKSELDKFKDFPCSKVVVS